jgi:ethanolamine utilization protein EutN
MILGRVCGTVVSTVQHPFYAGKKQLLVRAIIPDGTPDGAFDGERYVIALDLVGAGIGETVLVEDEGTSARQLMDAPNAPVRSVIVGIVDAVDVMRDESSKPEGA